MTYRKFKADYLFLGDRIATHNTVLITTREGTVQDVVAASEAGEGVEQYNGILSPGFVNCHCHLELSHLKGIVPEGVGLVNFLSTVIRQRGADRDRVLDAIAAGNDFGAIQNPSVRLGRWMEPGDRLASKKILLRDS